MIPTLVSAQEMIGRKWWHLPQSVKFVELSNQEKEKLDEMYVETKRKLIDLKSAVEKEQFELDIILDKKISGDAAAMEQFNKLEKARWNLAKERFSFLLSIRKLIGFERFQQVKQVHAKNRKANGKAVDKKDDKKKKTHIWWQRYSGKTK